MIVLRTVFKSFKKNNPQVINSSLQFHLTGIHNSNKSNKTKDLILYRSFESIKDKNKSTYMEMIKIFEGKDKLRRGHVDFVYAALKNMKTFGVEKDIDVYKSLIDVLPKGKFIPESILQAEFLHYPKQQQCMVDLLEQMEDNGVLPDYEIESMLLNIFGKTGIPLRKFWRMMYWMPKFKNLSPWPLPRKIPDDMFELAKLAVTRMCTPDIQSQLTIYFSSNLKDALEDTWIVNGQSQTQKKLLEEHDRNFPIFVEGPFRIWIRNKSVNYFILKGDPKPLPSNSVDLDDVSNISIPLFGFEHPPKTEVIKYPSVHEQEDGVIFALCVTGTSSRDSLLSWIRHLEKDGNSALKNIAVTFKLKAPKLDVEKYESSDETNVEKKR